jgi:hypothetical protein
MEFTQQQGYIRRGIVGGTTHYVEAERRAHNHSAANYQVVILEATSSIKINLDPNIPS